MHDGPNTKDVLVAERYRLREATRADADTVRRAVDETVGRTVVLEKLPLDVLPQTRIAATVHHPHLVSILDVVEEPDALWLVREDLEPPATRSLAQLVGDHGPMALPAAALIGAQVAAGLAAGHAAGVAHGALAPDRILVTDTGTGPIAKISGLGSSSATDARTDVRSLGAALSVAVGGNAVEPMAALIRQLTDDDPAARPTAVQAQVELARIAAGAAGPARIEPLPPPRGRGRLRFVGVIAAAGVAVIAVVLAVAMLATSASPALTPTASVPPVALADERTLDPCSLVDVAPLAPVWHATISPGYGVFAACTAAVIPGADVDVHVDVELLNDPIAALQVDVGLRNPIAPRIVPGPQEDGYCRRFVLLPGSHTVAISAGDGLTDRTDYCSVADIATEAVVARFVGGGIARRGSAADRSALAGITACDLLSRSSVADATTAAGGEPADEPVNGYAGWSCDWGAVWVDYIRESTPGSLESWAAL
jgi:hypothetical protein